MILVHTTTVELAEVIIEVLIVVGIEVTTVADHQLVCTDPKAVF